MDIINIQKRIAPTLEKYGIRRASVFGSVSRGEDTPKSDVDIIISLGKPMGMFSYMRMKREIMEALGREVDILTEKSLNRHIKPYILKDQRVIYER